jgi:hypothetical protein
MFGAERVDPPELDIHPMGIAVYSSGASTGMIIIHHGRWVGRTTTLPADFWNVVPACSTGSYFFARPPEGKTAGSLDELGPGQKFAFQRIVAALSGSTRGAD